MTAGRMLAMLCLALIVATGCTSTSVSTGGLKTENLKFAAAKDGPVKSDRKFKKSEPVWILFDVQGFQQKDDDTVQVQQDLEVTGPDGKSILKKENILDVNQKFPRGTNNLNANNEVTLPKDAPVGDYKAVISLRDKVGGGTATLTESFSITE